MTRIVQCKAVTIPTRSGTIEVPCAFRLGDAGVTRAINGLGGWVITHIPTGFCLPASFAYPKKAEKALREIDAVVDWPGFVEAAARGEVPNAAGEARRICEAHGGLVWAKQRRPDTDETVRRALRARIDAAEGLRVLAAGPAVTDAEGDADVDPAAAGGEDGA